MVLAIFVCSVSLVKVFLSFSFVKYPNSIKTPGTVAFFNTIKGAFFMVVFPFKAVCCVNLVLSCVAISLDYSAVAGFCALMKNSKPDF